MNDTHYKTQSFILAVHPTARGLGWVLFESVLSPIDWAVVRSTDNSKCLARVERLIERYSPDAIALEDFERKGFERVKRIQRLSRAIIHLAANRGIDTCVYPRAAIRTCFLSYGAKSRYEIAQAISVHIDAFKYRMPPLRKAWMSQDPRLSIFDAASLALTHFAITGSGKLHS